MDASVKSSVPTLIRVAKEEQAQLKQLSNLIATRQDVIKRVIELLEGPAFNNSSPPLSVAQSIRIRDPVSDNSQTSFAHRYDDYPRKGSRQEKIAYVLSKKNVAMLSVQIQDSIREIEGPTKSKDTLKNFHYMINSMASNNEVLVGRLTNRRYTFYILPCFLNDIGQLKEEHIPDAKSFGNLDEANRNKITDCFLN
jgi:hypothetical protein